MVLLDLLVVMVDLLMVLVDLLVDLLVVLPLVVVEESECSVRRS